MNGTGDAPRRQIANTGDSAPRRQIPSTDDARTVNNVMRHEYKVLTDGEKIAMQAIKDKGLELFLLLDAIGRDNGASPSRELALAKTKVEEAVMWGVKHITR